MGLIITFSSGLFLNYRVNWHPLNYVYETSEIDVSFKIDLDLSEDILNSISNEFDIDDQIVWISYEHVDIEFDRVTDKGKLKKVITTPVLGQMIKLHIETNRF